MRSTFTTILIIFGIIGLLIVTNLLPEKIDTTLGSGFRDTLLPTLKNRMDEISAAVAARLEKKKEDTMQRAQETYNNEKTALVRGLADSLFPLIEDYDIEAISALAEKRLHSMASANGLKYRTEKAGTWSIFGKLDATEAGRFQTIKATEYAFVEVVVDFDKQILKQTLRSEKASFDHLLAEIRARIQDINDSTQNDTLALQQELSKTTRWQIGLVMFFCTLVIVAVVLFLLYRIVIIPIDRTTNLLSAMAAGDLQVNIIGGGKNETARLLTPIKAIIDSFTAHVDQVKESASKLGAEANRLEVISQETQLSIKQQLSDTVDSASGMGQSAVASREIADAANLVLDATDRAGNEASEGARETNETQKSIDALAHEVREAGRIVHDLGEKTQKIGSVLVVIKEIAVQTNLLALNAAIEAARAGEQGRGFAVVAAEVRSLSNRTQLSTHEIQEIVEHVQRVAKDAVRVMEVGGTKADASVEQAIKAGKMLRVIATTVNNIGEMNMRIASATTEQSQAAESIHENLVHISEAANKTAANAKETASSGKTLSNLANELNEELQQFQL